MASELVIGNKNTTTTIRRPGCERTTAPHAILEGLYKLLKDWKVIENLITSVCHYIETIY